MKMNTSSPHDKLPILEEGWRCEKDNNVSILKRIEKRSSWSRFLEIVKIILYLELIFFIGWVGCIFLTDHIGNVKACGTSAIECTPSDINNQIDHKHSVTGIRDKRTIEEDELKRESCISNMNVTRDKIVQLTNQFILGEDSDTNILMLREKCRLEIVSLTLRVMMDKLISTTYSSDPTEEQWRTFALNIKQGIINSTGEEYRQQVEASGPPTPEIVNDLRTAIESMIRNYKDCEKVVPVVSADDASTTPSIGDLLNEREKCERIGVTLKEISRPLIVQIIPGDSSDPSIIQLREQVENITTLMAVALSFDTRQVWSLDLITEQVANLTNEKWREYISTIRNEVLNSTDSEQRQQLETNAPVTQEMINDIRTGVNKHIDNVRNCDELNVVINDIRKHVKEDHMRLKRDSNPISEHGLLGDYLENDVLNMVNLFALRNSDRIQ